MLTFWSKTTNYIMINWIRWTDATSQTYQFCSVLLGSERVLCDHFLQKRCKLHSNANNSRWRLHSTCTVMTRLLSPNPRSFIMHLHCETTLQAERTHIILLWWQTMAFTDREEKLDRKSIIIQEEKIPRKMIASFVGSHNLTRFILIFKSLIAKTLNISIIFLSAWRWRPQILYALDFISYPCLYLQSFILMRKSIIY